MQATLPKLAIIGRPNVGKSTLFNRLIGRRQAIVDDIPGVTRDRQYGTCDWGAVAFTVIDTGGFVTEPQKQQIENAIKEQALLAVEEAECIVFLVDGRVGLTPTEETLARLLRKQTKPVFLAVNKIDLERHEQFLAEFYKLGFNETFAISAETSRGISDLLDALLPHVKSTIEVSTERSDLKIALLGRPNVGKSTLLNALLGEDRAVVHHEPGTTRDPLNIRIERGSLSLEFVDTAGIRRKSQTKGKLEKVSVLKSLKSVDKSHLVMAVMDAQEGLTAQDFKVLNRAQEKGKGAMIVLNKWDLVPTDAKVKGFREWIAHKYKRHSNIPVIAVSAKTKRGVNNLFQLIDQVRENYSRRVSTGELNRLFQKAVDDHAPPLRSGKNVRLFYITQTGWAPPAFVIFCNHPKLVDENYLRYLERTFRERFNLEGVPIRWILRQKR